ncbi:hypothetical protein [Paraferrimonas sedimenticola]|uniref:Uncharacterized protein n=1 Tax=Paraferrimonas sedimenticola TaxID=375674 RepID=A0AA37RV83_9GAMM|nr:hypothetical protein [Paraferrimonas sedimenticola]GLP95227.1 hypothetical protein GCM10007895_05330 [Paraferrimonas sedimenticola]
MDLETFLNEAPLYTPQLCSDLLDNYRLGERKRSANKGYLPDSTSTELKTIRPLLYCSNDACKSPRYFELIDDSETIVVHTLDSFNRLSFCCSNCKLEIKHFFLKFHSYVPSKNEYIGFETAITVEKVGEMPRFGKPIPKKALDLIGGERQLFFKGHQCENQGFGIAAFAYYRRILDAKKDKIFDKVIKVAQLTGGYDQLVNELQDAKAQPRFADAIRTIKHAIPESLLVNGKNPLTLMYRAVSEGLHNKTDEQCLQYATALKTVLFQFSEKLESAMKEDREIKDALKLLESATN